ncbi:MAG: sensor histidine kinase [bacterium]
MLNQVFQNLVSNAVKFSDDNGTIELALRTRGGQALFSVSNTGRPIPREDQCKVFDRFYRGDKSRGRVIEGSGLGLSLAREIARAHGGDVIIEQSDEHATRFVLSLPLDPTRTA